MYSYALIHGVGTISYLAHQLRERVAYAFLRTFCSVEPEPVHSIN